jgi:DNA-binding transcriptional MerR regulator
MWSVKDVTDLIGAGRSTVQQRADAYSWALSDTASPGKGKTRYFSPRDVAIMQDIDRMQREGLSHDQIESFLRNAVDSGQFEDVMAYPDMEPPEGSISLAEHTRLMGRAEAMIQEAMSRAKAAEGELQKAKERIAYLEGQMDLLQARGDEYKELHDEINLLNREIARKEFEIEILKEQSNNKGK